MRPSDFGWPALVVGISLLLLSQVEEGAAAGFVAFTSGVGLIAGCGWAFAIWVRGPQFDDVTPTGVQIQLQSRRGEQWRDGDPPKTEFQPEWIDRGWRWDDETEGAS